jgi:phosphoenolpyruvate carboxykinase (ATP)
MSLRITRRIIDAILDGSLEETEMEEFPIFGFKIPKAIDGINEAILNPRLTWRDHKAYDEALSKLATMFSENFKKYTDNEAGKLLAGFGPKVS